MKINMHHVDEYAMHGLPGKGDYVSHNCHNNLTKNASHMFLNFGIINVNTVYYINVNINIYRDISKTKQELTRKQTCKLYL